MPNRSHSPLRALGHRPHRVLSLMLRVLTLALTGAASLLANSGSTTFNGLWQAVNLGSVAVTSPSAVAVAPDGTLYLADAGHSRVVTVNPQGAASVLQGLTVTTPSGLALDSAGNLYVADGGAGKVFKVAPASSGGSVTPVDTGSVTLSSGCSGLAVDPSGNLYIADTGNHRIVEVTSGGASVLPITLTTALNAPEGLATDTHGTLYIADTLNDRIVSVPGGGGTGTPLALTITPGTPTAVAVDSLGNLYVTDHDHGLIEADTTLNAKVHTDPAHTLNLFNPSGVAVDPFGAVFVADTGNNQAVRAFQAINPGIVSGLAQYSLNASAVNFGHLSLGTATGTSLTLPVSAAVSVSAVKVFTQGTENLDFKLGTGTTALPTSGPEDAFAIQVTFLPTAPGQRRGAVVVYDNGNNPILTIPIFGFSDAPVASLSPGMASVIATTGENTNYPFQLALDGAGGMWVANYVQDGSSPKVVKVAAGGGATAVATGSVTLGSSITGIAVDGAGNQFIADYYYARIVVVPIVGSASVMTLNGLGSVPLGEPTELAFDAAGNLFIADYGNGRIVEVSGIQVTPTSSAGLGHVIGTGTYTFSGSTITGVTVDPFGTVYIAGRTSNNSHVVKVTAAGAASELVTSGLTLSDPQGVCTDGFGNLWIQDSGHSRLVRVTTAGEATAVTFTGLTGPSSLASGFGVTADATGNLYIPDWSNNRIVKLDLSQAALTFAATKVGFTSADSPRTAPVTNLGNQNLVFSADPGYTADFSQNVADTNPVTSTTSLKPGTSADVAVNFTPQSVGALSATLTLTNDHLNVAGSTQQVSVSGTGLTPGDTTATTVALSPASLTNGQFVSITATVADTAAGHTASLPTGSVTFTDLVGTTLTNLNGGNSVALSGGTATLASVRLQGIGTHTITAAYGGVSGSYLSSTGSNTVPLALAPVTLAGQAAAITVTSPGVFTLTATGPTSALPVPSGTIAWAVTNSSGTAVANGTATLAPGTPSSVHGASPYTGPGSPSSTTWTVPANLLPAGTYTASCTYGGDADYAASATPTLITLQVNQATPTVTLTASALTATPGTSLAFTATLTSALSTLPTGTVSFYDGATLLGTGTLGSGTATFSTSALTVGTHTITASYGGDAVFAVTAGGNSLQVVVSQATPILTLTLQEPTAPPASPVTFTAAVTSPVGTPTGTVSFFDGTTLLRTDNLASGSDAFTTSSLTVGSHAITAVYNGDTVFKTVTSPAQNETISQLTPNVVEVLPDSGPYYQGQPVTVTVTVSNALNTTPSGTVTVLDGGTPVGTATLSGGTATLALASLALGDNNLTASYSGDTVDLPAVSAPVDAVVLPPAVVVTVPPSPVVTTAGNSASTQLTLSSLGPLGAPITFTVTGLPQGVACTFDKDSVDVSAGPEVITATLTTTPRLKIIGSTRGLAPLGGLGALLGCGIFALPRRRRRKAGRYLGAFLVLLVGAMTACTIGGTTKGITTGPSGTPAGTYTITLAANSPGATGATTTIQLTVQ